MISFDLSNALKEACKLDGARPLVLGFSGGPDSSALLHMLQAAGVATLLAHFDHALRRDSAADALHAAKVAASYSLPFFTARSDAAAHAKEHSLSIEEAARELRYRFLFDVADKQNAQAVAVAHNADDQAETVLMHLLRGAGPAGLRGMAPRALPNPWSETIPLVRPLLSVSRAEIERYCTENELHPLIDPTNADPVYFRNRLRRELLPLLESYVPGVKDRLGQTADLLAADQALLDQLIDGAWRRCLSDRGVGYLQLDLAVFNSQPLALQRGLLRKTVAVLRMQHRDVDFAAIQRALTLASANKPTTPRDWVAGLFLQVEDGKLWIADWGVDLPTDWPQAPEREINIEVPSQLTLGTHWRLSAKPTAVPAHHSPDEFEVWLDLETAGDELVLRRRKPGDRFQPLGMPSGSQKLADFFVNEKLPQRARDAWPLLCKGDVIIWVPGYRIGHAYRLREDSISALHLNLTKVG